jgi:hypothetical protein
MTTTRSEQSVNDAGPRSPVGSRRHRHSFWVVACGFLVAQPELVAQ